MTGRSNGKHEQAGEQIVDVLVPVAIDQAYSYRVPKDLVLAAGDLVEVPLGTRQSLGAVWSIRNGLGGNFKAVSALCDCAPLGDNLRGFIDWVARWTLAPRGMAPSAASMRQGLWAPPPKAARPVPSGRTTAATETRAKA